MGSAAQLLSYSYTMEKLSKSSFFRYIFGPGAFSAKMLLVRIVENNKIDAYFRAG